MPPQLEIGSKSDGIRYAQHQDRPADCWEVRTRNSSEWCHFIRSTPDCQTDSGFLNYLNGVFCLFPSGLLPLAVTLYGLWLLYLFLILAVTAEKFFCPNLSAISTNLRLAHNVAVSFRSPISRGTGWGSQ
ncbi:hypothetical protein KIL84_009226 [Mauremys mutica]|uniref:Uncharacterized protein n=1 Tax=Mauremys mutica TaxID=74926 RepID=A0A9D4B4Y6_9SAUR|nr:hypothetical protein KIL84_009226 [Mauremys mutica]